MGETICCLLDLVVDELLVDTDTDRRLSLLALSAFLFLVVLGLKAPLLLSSDELVESGEDPLALLLLRVPRLRGRPLSLGARSREINK